MRKTATAWLVALSLTWAAGGGSAQAQGIGEESKADLRARQAVLYDAMLAAPEDLEAMFAYAGVSARLEDYEAAISTLERMLIFEPDLPRVRLELGALYYRLGAYPVAERYFRSVRAAPDVPEAVRGRIDGYLGEIERRQARSRFTGRVEVGLTLDSNANLAPDSVLFGGVPATLDADSESEGDIGLRLRAQVRHRYDLRRANDDHWRTDASYFGRHYREEDEGDIDAVFLRTGPSLSLDDEAFGPKLRPFVEGEYVRTDGGSLYRGIGGGAELRLSPTDQISAFGELRLGWRDYDDRDDEDGVTGRVLAGLAYLPGRDLRFGVTALVQRDEADEDFNSNTEGALRLTASYAYDPGLSFAGEKWVVSGYGSIGLRVFDDPDPVVDPDEDRRDVEYRVGLEHTAYFRGGFYGSLGVSALRRDSNIVNFDLDNYGLTASVGYKF